MGVNIVQLHVIPTVIEPRAHLFCLGITTSWKNAPIGVYCSWDEFKDIYDKTNVRTNLPNLDGNKLYIYHPHQCVLFKISFTLWHKNSGNTLFLNQQEVLVDSATTPVVDWVIFFHGIHQINMVDSVTNIGAMLRSFFQPALPATGFSIISWVDGTRDL